MRTYFIGGLGCNAYYPQKFFDYFPFPIQYLDVYSAGITSLTDLESWFTETIDAKDVTLIAHSLGGDLAVYLANHCSAVKNWFC